MGWRKIILSAQERAEGAGQSLKIDFEIAFIAAGVPETAALFLESDSDTDSFYFSPEASRIFRRQLDAARAHACPPPESNRVGIAVGYGGARTLLHAAGSAAHRFC